MKNREILKAALRQAADEEFAWIPEEGAIRWEYSDSFIAKMARLNQAQKHPGWRLINSAAKRVAIIIIAFIITLSVVTVSIDAFRLPILQFFVNTNKIFSEIRFGVSKGDDHKDLDREFQAYDVTYVPQGFTEWERSTAGSQVYIVWKNADGELIQFQQSVIGSSVINVDNEHGFVEEITIGSYEGVLYYDGPNLRMLFWIADNYLFTLDAPGTIPFEDLRDMVLSVQIAQSDGE